jgi:phage terminase large subunit
LAQTTLTKVQAVKLRAHYRQHPEWFFEHILGFKPYRQQIEIAQSVVHNRTTTVASCNSAGKTGTSGCLVPWYLASFPESLVITTAPTWRQVKDLLWSEVNTRYAKAKIPLGGEPPNMVGWQISSNHFAVGVSSKDPNRIQGYHADSGHILVIADEAAAIEELIFEGIYAILTSADARFLMLGNPTSQSGTFRESFKPGSLANRIKIDGFETPNFLANGIHTEEQLIEAIESGRKLEVPYHQLISPIWAYERLKKWGQGSHMYQSRVRANFPEVGENNLIPLNQIEAACTNERLERILGLNLVDTGDLTVEKHNDEIRKEALSSYIAAQNTVRGVDVARFGSDSTVIQPRWGKVVGFAKAYHKEDTMQTAGRVWPLIRNIPTDLTSVDVIGVGGGVVDRLHELQREQEAEGHGQFAQVVGTDVASAPTEVPEGLPQMVFSNKRAELYWKLREIFEAGDIYLMPDDKGNVPDDLMAELSDIQYEFRGNKIYIEEKKDMKKRLLKSPDRADALMLSYAKSGYTDWSLPESTGPDLSEEDEDDWEPSREEDGEYVDNGLETVY